MVIFHSYVSLPEGIVANLCQGFNVGHNFQKGVRPQFGLPMLIGYATSCVLLCFIIDHCFVCYCYNISILAGPGVSPILFPANAPCTQQLLSKMFGSDYVDLCSTKIGM